MARAVLIGLAVDIGGTLIAALYLVIGSAVVGAIAALAAGGGESLLAVAFSQSAPAPSRLPGFILGTGFSVLGGFVGGRLYLPAPVRVGICVGVASCIVALPLTWLMGTEEHGVAWAVLEYTITLVAAAFGGALARLGSRPGAA